MTTTPAVAAVPEEPRELAIVHRADDVLGLFACIDAVHPRIEWARQQM